MPANKNQATEEVAEELTEAPEEVPEVDPAVLQARIAELESQVAVAQRGADGEPPDRPFDAILEENLSSAGFGVVVDEFEGEKQDRKPVEGMWHRELDKPPIRGAVQDARSGLWFTKPGQALPVKSLYTVKAVHPQGALIQLGFEDQINNQAAGDPGDAIGLRRMIRKGIIPLINMRTLVPIYCPMWGCYAPANPVFKNFCSEQHRKVTTPNARLSEVPGMNEGFAAGATTSKLYLMP